MEVLTGRNWWSLTRGIDIVEIRSKLNGSEIVGIDLFSGAGGMSLGAELAGVSVKYAIEKDKYAAETYQANHKNTIMINQDICEIDTNIFDLEDGCCILFGGAPCQGFSTSNRRTNNRNNPQNWLYLEFIRFLEKIQPEWFVFENVTGLVELESGCFFEGILNDFEKKGYKCSYAILNAADFGVPQKRSRLFIVGSKSGIEVDLLPKKTEKIVTVKEAFQDLPLLHNGANIDVMPYACDATNEYSKCMRGNLEKCTGNLVSRNAPYVVDRYKYVKQGENWTAIPENLMKNYADLSKCHTGIYYRLLENRPSVVIGNYRKNMLIHPYQNRGLSVREAARLQSFPDTYTFKGSIGYQQQQVGNAVPPLLAKHVFKTIINNI